ncbi:hypothetical protein GO988_04630 [Hymenobacter sp. HMF4947]|uniref:Uncharacterized protein n=1 Tax=Hymenobacter ginkgonis TaxID=2682976 RepID=A0A7K1TB43_9BACT|nr:hypothetical protein [Hymenobacter ginkgonis]MVN75605.1 hypothetical protein [Hymenobacter ginkgonis]
MPATVPAPQWARSSTAGAPPAATSTPSTNAETSLPEAPVPPVVEALPPLLPPTPLPTVQSPDGRFVLTDTHLTVLGQTFGLRELEQAEVQRVRWVLWVLLGGLGLTTVLIAFLQNWLHTLPAMVGLATTALLLAYGQRGTNRLRLWRLGREAAHFTLPGELATWQRLVGELNRRISRVHDRAAAEAAALLAAAEAELVAVQALPPAPDNTLPTPFA